MWRCIRTLLRDAAPLPPRRLEVTRYHPGLPFRPRNYTVNTLRAPAETSPSSQDDTNRTQSVTFSSSSQRKSMKEREKTALVAGWKKDGSELMGSRQREMLRQLEYLKDPLVLAEHVQKRLEKGEHAQMLDLVRLASKNMECIVSWNHLIDGMFRAGKVSIALKTYQEMKKRAQFPDSHTYTILLRGLAKHAHFTQALPRALAIYHSMSAPNSRVQPNIIHTNAVLQVCARANDMDALWGVAGRLPIDGSGAANGFTYTTILNAIRMNALINTTKDATKDDIARVREQAIMQGRRMWEDIIGRWRAANILMDEKLVCAMGRLLLIGSRPRDWDDALSLIEQTTAIPRLVPRLGTPDRDKAGLPRVRAPNTPNDMKHEDEFDHAWMTDESTRRGGEFNPIDITKFPQKGDGKASLTYVTPSNNALSLVLEACQRIVASKAAAEYWNYLTDPSTYAIKPDLDNYHVYLRILRQSRASAKALELIQSDIIPSGHKITSSTVRIAMSTCVRDKNNPNALVHASQLLSLMEKNLSDPDAKTACMYTDFVADQANPEIMAAAVKLLTPVASNFRSLLVFGGEGSGMPKGDARSDIFTFLRRFTALCHKALDLAELTKTERKDFTNTRHKITSFLLRAAKKYQEYEARETPEKKMRHNRPAKTNISNISTDELMA